jgi:seryl-tRNA synthetase
MLNRMDDETLTREYVPLSVPVPAKFAQELRKRLFYVSDAIVDFALLEEDDMVRGIEVACAGRPDPRALGDKIDRIVATDILRQKEIPPTIIWRTEAAPTYQPEMLQCLLDRGIAFEPGPGLVAFGEPLIALVDAFDTRLKGIARDTFGASEFQYPTLISTSVLEQLDYFTSFPQFVMFVTRLHNDVDVYRAFLDEYGAHQRISPSIFEYCRNLDYCLPPTMCYHTFDQLRGSQLTSNRVITSRGKSFRFESKYATGLERLWDFTIREIVFLGTREFVLESRQRFMRQVQALMQDLGLRSHCEVANDPFFVGPQTASRILSQRLMELKYELRLHVDSDRTIAAASFNFHDTFFGKRFNISSDGTIPIQTGCIGFGLERLAFAFLCQHGLDQPDMIQRISGSAG